MQSLNRYRFVLALVAVVVAGHCVARAAKPAAGQVNADGQKETIEVDLSKPGPAFQHRAAGFTRISGTEPSEAMLLPLKPTYFLQPTSATAGAYAAFDVAPRAQKLGATVIAQLSDLAPHDGTFPGKDGQWSNWENAVEVAVKQAKAANLKIYWDIWNEPETSESWKGTRNQYFELWFRTVHKIRAIDPQAVILGPSTKTFETKFAPEFLKDAKDYHVLPTIVTWHEPDPKDLVTHATSRLENMWQDGVNITRVAVTQYGQTSGGNSPGTAVWFLSQLERANIEFAVRGPMGETSPRLGGVLTADSKPQAIWHIYQTYAQFNGRT